MILQLCPFQQHPSQCQEQPLLESTIRTDTTISPLVLLFSTQSFLLLCWSLSSFLQFLIPISFVNVIVFLLFSYFCLYIRNKLEGVNPLNTSFSLHPLTKELIQTEDSANDTDQIGTVVVLMQSQIALTWHLGMQTGFQTKN